MTDPHAPQPQYEFSAAENKTFRLLSFGLIGAAAIMGVLGLVKLGKCGLIARQDGLTFGALLELVDGVILAAVAAIAVKTQRSIHHIISTEGDDIGHLMTGIKSLRSYFTIQAVGVLILIGSTLASFQTPSNQVDPEDAPASDDAPASETPAPETPAP
jgi:hypothetical protein